MNMKTANLDPTQPPITLLLWEYQVELLLKALRLYTPRDKKESKHQQELLALMEQILYPGVDYPRKKVK